MSRPNWTRLYHFTHIDHLASIIRGGLVADTVAQQSGLVQHEAGDVEIKDRRRRISVPIGAKGAVSDYVPFYFATRSPMLFRIFKGGVATYDGDQSDLVYLCSTIERLDELGIEAVVSDRNAAVRVAAFSSEQSEWGSPGFVDWKLMNEKMWNDIEEYPDRMERRMAECLVHDRVPWNAIQAVGTIDEHRAGVVRQLLGDTAVVPKIVVRPEWYY